MSISILILTLNEEANMPECLQSVKWSDDIVVLDSFSSDRTVKIAEDIGARVIQRRFDNWSAHQNWALAHIPFKHPWVFYLDADERMTEELKNEILAIAQDPNLLPVAYYCGHKNMFMGRWIRHAFPPRTIMRFMRPSSVRFEREVHPVPVIDGPHGYLRGMLLHYNFSKGISEWIDKHNRYSQMEAHEGMKLIHQPSEGQPGLFDADPALRRRALKNLSFRLPWRPALKFLYLYLWQRGWLDGMAGFTYCVLQSFYEYMIVLKMREMERRAQGVTEMTPVASIQPVASAATQKTIFINRYFFPDHSATSQLLSDLTFDLASRGQDIHVITSGQLYTDPRASLLTEEVICGVKVHRVRTSRFGRARLWGRMLDYVTFYFGATWRLLRTIEPGDVVVAKTDPPMLSVCAAWAARMRKGLLINWVQDLFPEVASSLDVPGIRFVAPILKRWRNDSLRQSQATVVLGELMAQRLRDENIPSDRITVIENWADGDVIQPVSRQDNPLLQEWRLEGKFVLGYSGNMGHVHEFKTMIDAAERLKDVTEIAFVFIGAGIARHWLETEVAERGLRNVQFQPYQPDDRLRWSLAVPDVHFVSLRPTLEGLIVPSKFYGIAAAGRAVIHIGDPDGEIACILEREQCGWNFCVGEVGPLTQCILRLFQKRHEVVEAGQRARRAFDLYYSRTQALNTWRELLDSVGGPVLVVSSEEENIPHKLPAAAGKE